MTVDTTNQKAALKARTMTFTEKQIAELDELHALTGLLKVEIVRRALDKYLGVELVRENNKLAVKEAKSFIRQIFSDDEIKTIRSMAAKAGIDEMQFIRKATLLWNGKG